MQLDGGAGGGQAPAIAVATFTGYDPVTGAPISLGSRVDAGVANGTFDVVVAGYGFATGDSVSLEPNQPGPITDPATVSGTVFVDPAGTTPGSITATIDLAATPADSVGQYLLVVTNAAGLRGVANVQINPAA